MQAYLHIHYQINAFTQDYREPMDSAEAAKAAADTHNAGAFAALVRAYGGIFIAAAE